MKIGIDVDDVVADLHPVWVAALNAAYGLNKTVDDIKQWHFGRDWGLSDEQIYKCLLPELYDTVQPCEGALDVVQELKAAGHTVYFVTTCHTREAWNAKLAWLHKHGFMDVRTAAFAAGPWASHKTKREVAQAWGIPVLVDDSIANCEDWPGVAYLLTRGHNRSSIYHGKRLRNFGDIVNEIGYMQARQGAKAFLSRPLPESLAPEPTFEGIRVVRGPGEVEIADSIVQDAMAYASKPTNPKDAVAVDKVPLHFVSGIVKAYAAIAHFLGNVKYGAWNYRAGGARASVYLSALARHIDKWTEGQENDPVDGTPHLANALACINILIESQANGNLVDDRPPSRIEALEAVYAQVEALMPQIRERYANRVTPKHYTIEDTAK